MSTACILVVDDEPLNLEIVSEYLSSEEDTDLVAADSGEAAWQMLQQPGSHFDLVLLDRMMPGLDGLSLLKRMKQDSDLCGIPVIMQTAASTPEQIGEGLLAGAYYYLTKPYRRDALLSIIRAALGDARTRFELQRQLHDHINALGFLEQGRFSVRTTADASRLAALIAQTCPKPDIAVLGISELLVNGVEHGNLGVSYAEKSRLKLSDGWQAEIDRRAALPENAEKRVHLDYCRTAQGIRIVVRDQGAGFDWQRYLDFDPGRAFDPNGRGIALARMMSFDTLHYENGGATAVVTINLPTDTAAPPTVG